MKQVKNFPIQSMIAEQMAETQRKAFELDPNAEITPFGEIIISLEESDPVARKRAMELLSGNHETT